MSLNPSSDPPLGIAALLARLTSLVAAATLPDGRTFTAAGLEPQNIHAARTPAQRTKLKTAPLAGMAVFVSLPGAQNVAADKMLKTISLSLKPVVTLEVVDTLNAGQPDPLTLVEAMIAAVHGQPVTAGDETITTGRRRFVFESLDCLAVDAGGGGKAPQVIQFYALTVAIG